MLSPLTDSTKKHSIADLEAYALSDTLIDRTSLFEFATKTVQTLKRMELKVLRTHWYVVRETIMYGVCEVSVTNSDISLADSILYVLTRFSSAQNYAPTFIGASTIDRISEPFSMSTGLAGEKKYQTQNLFIDDVIEFNCTKLHQALFFFPEIKAALHKKRLKKYQVYGAGIELFKKADLPLTKYRYFADVVDEMAEEDNYRFTGLDIFRAMEQVIPNLSLPDQYNYFLTPTEHILERL